MEHENTYFTTTEAAKYVRCSSRTLEAFRLSGSGPKFVKAGRRVLYRSSDLEAWLQAQTFQSTSEAEVSMAVAPDVPTR